MRSFQSAQTTDPVPGDVVAMLRRIDFSAGSEARYADQLPKLLAALRERTRIESITASNAIEGVVVDGARITGLASGQADRFRNRNEAEFAGYTAALDYLNQADPGDLNVGLILHLHRLVYSHTKGRGGHLKSEDNVVVDRNPDGTRRVRFTPVSAQETPFFLGELATRTSDTLRSSDHHPLITVAASVLDLLCIHPFADGNGRVARLVTAYLLHHAGYGVGQYVSIEQLIYERKDAYYAALETSTEGWFDDGNHDIWPWTRYLLARIEDAYGRFEARVAAGTSGGTKQDRVRDFVLLHAPQTFTIADIRRAVPGISDNTIRLVLADLKAAKHIANDGTGRGATWQRLPSG